MRHRWLERLRQRPRIRAWAEEAEPRLLFSADAIGGLAAIGPQPQGDSPVAIVRMVEAEGATRAAEAVSRPHELVVVDPAVADAQRLVDAIATQRPDAALTIVQLEPGADALGQIADALAALPGVSALHVVAHGEPGAIRLGDARLDAAALDASRDTLAAWGAALTADADLLLYGCDVAASAEGLALLARLAELTGADVAASLDPTGSAALGGDWQLEARSGEVGTPELFGLADPVGWSGLLDTVNDPPMLGTPLDTSAVALAVGAGDADARSVLVRGDGSLLLVGTAIGPDSLPGFTVTAVDADGSPIQGFGANGSVRVSPGDPGNGAGVARAALQADGRIVIAGTVEDGGRRVFAVVRLNADGSPDTAFGTGGVVRQAVGDEVDEAGDLVIGADGTITVVGGSRDDGVDVTYSVIRLTSAGALDTGFGTGGIVRLTVGSGGPDVGTSVALTQEGRIVIGGGSINATGVESMSIAVLDDSGAPFSGFSDNGRHVVSINVHGSAWANDVAVQSDGRFILAGTAGNGNDQDFAVVRLDAAHAPGGEMHLPFGDSGVRTLDLGGDDIAHAVVIQPDGALLVAGESTVAGVTRYAVVRLDANGDLDPTFGTGGITTLSIGPADDLALSLALQSDGRILVSGTTVLDGWQRVSAVRLLADGSVDPSFGATVAAGLGGGAVYVEDGLAVVIEPDAALYDPELAALAGGAGQYADARIELARSGGAVAQDAFEALGSNLSFDGGVLRLSGAALGTVDQSSGRLELRFLESTSQAQVDEVVSSIGYRYVGDAPPASVTLTWSLRDGNTGSQGSGGEGVSTATSTVTIVPVDDAPVITSHGGVALAALSRPENGTVVTRVTATDVDGPSIGFQIAGGEDAALFGLDPASGDLWFLAPPDAESPTDADGNGVYRVLVEARSDLLTDTQLISVTVTDADESDVTTPVDVDPARNAVTESRTQGSLMSIVASGTSVGITAAASDADATTNTIAWALADDAGGRFAIDAGTGVVTVADGALLDREAAASHTITVRATSADGSTSTQVFTIEIDDADELDITPPTDADATRDAVAENAANGTTVGLTATASDGDATTNAITWSLDDDAGGRFAIHATTGVVTVANGSRLDREASASHAITVRATSADGSTGTRSFTIAIDDVDEFDVGAPADTNPTRNAVVENAVTDTAVGLVAMATDADPDASIAYTLADSAGGRFAIDAATGVVTVADGTLLDRESAASHTITVRATSSDGSTATQAFTIEVDDADEFDVTVPVDVDPTRDAVLEGAANGTSVGIVASAVDADATTNAITWSLDDDAGGRFAIHATTGVVTVADGVLLDHDVAVSHVITVRATSADGSTSTRAFTIAVDRADEFDVTVPVDADTTRDAVAENAAGGTVVGITASATDADPGSSIAYSLVDDAGGRFAIDPSTGVVTVADGTLLDREAAVSHAITVRATSNDGSTATQTFTIALDDVDEFDVTAPGDADAARDAVAENAAIGTTVGITASATDADATTNTIAWSLDDTAGGRFAIDAATGVVTVADPTQLNRESAASHTITVRATSADGSSSSRSFTIALDDVDEFDVAAPLDTDPTRDAVVENAPDGTTVGIAVAATDADATLNTVSWTLDDDAGGRFAIDAVTAVVTVADGSLLDREAAAWHTIMVRATSADGSTSTRGFLVELDDADEFDVTVPTDADATRDAVPENAANGTPVGIDASASDADATTNAITWSLADDAGGRFAIDAATGVVTVADGALLDREAAASHAITVRATSADGSARTQLLTIAIDDVEEPLVLLSHGGDDDVALGVDENTTVVTTVLAVDPDGAPILYQIAGGADAARFSVDPSTGVLGFIDPPDHEGPTDADADNVYEVTVSASDGTDTVTQAFAVTVADVGALVVTTTADLVDGDTSSITALRANPGDDGAISLREALLAANATPNVDGPDRIRFDLPGAGAATITPGSSLPTITDTVILDGRSDPDFVPGGGPVVILDGNDLAGDGLVLGSGADGSTIAGLLIRDFGGRGLLIDTGSDGNRIVGNWIGALDAAGAPLAGEENGSGGLRVQGAANVIGGADAGDGNLVSGNLAIGIRIVGVAAAGNLVIGNRVGVAADGVTALGNASFGIQVMEGATGQRIGGTAPGEGNLVAFNGGAGIRVGGWVADSSASLLGNRLVGNGGLGIDLTPASGASGVTPNDVGDADTGGNGLLNFPVLTGAQRSFLGLLIDGSLTVAADATYRIEFWSSPAGDPSGHGEAATFVGATTVTGSGELPFSVWFDGTEVSAEHVVTATATVVTGPDQYGETSEFAANVTVVSVNTAPVLHDGLPMSFLPVTEDEVGNAGQTVASVIASAGGDRITDADPGAPEGIALFAVQSGEDGGRFEYSIDAGATWQSVGTVSSGSALLLRDTDRLRFVPGARTAETGSIGFRAWDRTYGAAGARVDASVVGGTTALSEDTATATIATTAVNDAPTVSVPASAWATTPAPVVFSTAQGNAISVADVDHGAGSVRVTLSAEHGTLTLGSTTGLVFVTGDGSADATIVFDGTIAQVNAALQGLSFAPSAGFGGLARLTVQADDRQAGPGGPGVTSATVPIGVGGDAFLQGDVLEVGLDRWGGFGSTGNAPAGFVSAGALLGAVADRQRDGWETYDGDFIIAGGPYEAWGVNVAGTTRVNGPTSGAIVGGTGAVTDDGTVARVDWTGATSSLAISQQVSVGATDLYADILVTLTNTTGAALSDVYYFRGVDPDNNHRTNASFSTVNTIVSQGDATGVAIVTAAQADGSQMSVVGYGADARVAIGTVAGNPVGAWAGTAYQNSGSKTGDDRVGVVFRIPTLAAGESVTLQMRYEFTAAAAPIVDLDANDSTATGGGSRVAFVEDGGPVRIADADARITDQDGTGLTRMTLSLQARPDGAAESLTADTTGTTIVASYAAGTLTLSGSASVAHYQQVLRTVSYVNTSQAPTEGDRTIRVTARDVVNWSSDVVATVAVSGVNDAPTFSGSVGSIVFTEGGAPAPIDAIAGVEDVELDRAGGGAGDYSGAFLTLAREGGANASDVFSAVGSLQFTGGQAVVGGIAIGTVTQAGGLLRIDFNAQATSSRVDTLLGSLAYSHTGDAPPASVRIEGRFNDGNIADAPRQGSGPARDVSGAFDLTIVPVDDAPVIVSHSGSFGVATARLENVTSVTTVSATDVDGPAISYVIAGGADAALFTIDAVSGALGFITAPDSELPTDADGNQVYEVWVEARSGGLADEQRFSVNVFDVDEFDVGAPVDADATRDAVAENAAAGTTVGVTASAIDADATTNAIGWSLVDDAGGRFAIDAGTGVVTVADGTLLDREAAASHTITVRATSADGSSSDRVFTIALDDVDEFDVIGLTDTDATRDAVAENAAVRTTVGVTVTAFDADATTNTITWSLPGDAGGRFAIDPGTGMVTVANGSPLDREGAASHAITVRATSADGSFSERVFTIALDDVDEYDVTVPVDVDAARDAVAENAATGTRVGVTGIAIDSDETTNALTWSLADDAGGRFAIDAVTGVVTVADGTLLDREAAASHAITVRTTSADGSSSERTFTIALDDVDDFDVTAPVDADATRDAVAENAATGTTVGLTASATDADATTNAITWSLADDAGGRFAIDAATGVVTVADGSLLDREAAASHAITVRATSADGSFSERVFTIAVDDVDEFDVTGLTDTDATRNAVAENAATGTTVGVSVTAFDADATTSTVTWSLSGHAGGRFAIDAATGVVTVANGTLLDREAAASDAITVRATSADGSFSERVFTIAVDDVDEFDVTGPVDADGTRDAVAENAATGTIVGLIATATDADATTNTVSWSLADDAGGRFAIDAASGVVTVADGTLLDREAAASHAITVRATSADGSSSERAFTIVLDDVDEFDVIAPTDADATRDAVAENAATGTTVGLTATAIDGDATTNAIGWSLVDDAGGRFAIDAATGVVTVANGALLDREATASHAITVRAASADGSTGERTFTIAVDDADEFDVTLPADADGTRDAVAENAATGTTVGLTATALDADAATNAITWSLADHAGGRFAIDAATGVVTVADGTLLDREAAASHAITVRATSADGSTSLRSFTIALDDIDEFDVAPPADVDPVADAVAENAAPGTPTGLVARAVDADATASVSYALLDDAGGRFVIDAATGAVTVAGGAVLDREADEAHTIVVRATSSDGSTSERAFSIALVDVDEYDIGAVVDLDPDGEAVDEHAPAGTRVGLVVLATDADATATVRYALSDDADGRFAIDATTGEVTVADPARVDREAAASHSVRVLATSSDGSTAERAFTIDLRPLDDNAPEFDVAMPRAIDVSENGTDVLVLQASDADVPARAPTFAIVGGADRDRFRVDAVTGRLSLVAAPDFEAPDDVDRDGVYEVLVAALDTEHETVAALTVRVADVPERPTLSVPALLRATEDTPLSIQGVRLGDPDRDVVSVVMSVARGRLEVDVSGDARIDAIGDGGASLTLVGSHDALVAALGTLRWVPGQDQDDADALSIVVIDRAGLRASGSVRLDVTPVNDPPVIAAPARSTMDEDAVLILGPGQAGRIVLDDVDDAGPIRLSLALDAGTLTLGATEGLAFLVGDGVDDSALVIFGTRERLQAALDGLVLRPPRDFHGAIALDALLEDASGAIAEARLPIVVNPVDDPAGALAPSLATVRGDAELRFDGEDGGTVRVTDVDGPTARVSVGLSVPVGTLSVVVPNGVSVSRPVLGTAGDALVLSGPRDAVNAALATLAYRSAVGWWGDTELSISVRSEDGPAGGGVTTKSLPIVVSPVRAPAPVAPATTSPTRSLDLPATPASTESERAVTEGEGSNRAPLPVSAASRMLLRVRMVPSELTVAVEPPPAALPGDGTGGGPIAARAVELGRPDRGGREAVAGATQERWDAPFAQADAAPLAPVETAGADRSGREALDAALDPSAALRQAPAAETLAPELTLERGVRLAGVALTAGSVWWAISGGATLWILLAAGPLARTFDPLPALLRDDREAPMDAAEEFFDTDRDAPGPDPEGAHRVGGSRRPAVLFTEPA